MFNPGDILLYTAPHLKFSTLITNGIRLIEGSPVEHVAVYLGSSSAGHQIIEALSDGVRIKILTKEGIFNRVDGTAAGFKLYGYSRLPNLQVEATNKVFAISAARYDLFSYGYLTDLNLFLQHGKTRLFPKMPWTVWFKSKKGYICSEVAQLVVGDVLELNHIDLPFKKIACLTEPDDFLQEPWAVTKT